MFRSSWSLVLVVVFKQQHKCAWKRFSILTLPGHTHSFQLRSEPAISLQGCSSLGGCPPSRPVGHLGLVFLPRPSRAEPWPYGGPPSPLVTKVQDQTGGFFFFLCVHLIITLIKNDLDMTRTFPQHSTFLNWMKLSVTWKIFLNFFCIFCFWSSFISPFFLSVATWFASTWSLRTHTLITMCLWVWLVFSPILLPFIWFNPPTHTCGKVETHYRSQQFSWQRFYVKLQTWKTKTAPKFVTEPLTYSSIDS